MKIALYGTCLSMLPPFYHSFIETIFCAHFYNKASSSLNVRNFRTVRQNILSIAVEISTLQEKQAVIPVNLPRLPEVQPMRAPIQSSLMTFQDLLVMAQTLAG